MNNKTKIGDIYNSLFLEQKKGGTLNKPDTKKTGGKKTGGTKTGGTKLPSTDKTTIPSPQPDKVDQTSTINLTPRTDPSYKIWLKFSEGDFETTHEKENDVFVFVKAIEKAYFSKNTKQDVY